MNALDDDLRTMFARQADAMSVPAPIIDQPVARVTSLDDRRPRRWLLAAAVVALLGVGGLALAQRDGAAPVDPASAPPAAPAFAYETPTVRLTADAIQVIVGDQVFIPHDVTVSSDPGDSGYTTLELIWTDGGQEQRIFLYFTSDGTQWWVDEIRTYGARTADQWITTQGRWFTSPVGTPWTGDLDLPNLRITGLTVDAFRRPDVCDRPVGPVAVVSAYAAIDAAIGSGFSGYVQVIDTATCAVLDAQSYEFVVSVDDPAIATAAEAALDGQPLRYDLSFLAAGATTVRITVFDAAGTEVGTAIVPVTVRAE